MSPAGRIPEVPERFRSQYEPFQTTRWRGWTDRALRGGDIGEWLERPDQLLDERAERWFKQGRNRLAEVLWPVAADGSPRPSLSSQPGAALLQAAPDGSNAPRTVVVKEFGAAGFAGNLRALLRPSRCARAWRQAFLLLERGFRTPRPLWIALPREEGKRGPSYLAVETAPPHTRLREALKQLRRGADEVELGDGRRIPADLLLRAVARFLRRMHDAGIWHRDFSGGNLLIPNDWRRAGRGNGPDLAGEGETTDSLPPFILIDVNRCRFFEPGALSLRQRMQDLERVSLGEGRQRAFYAAYAEADPVLENAAAVYLRHARRYRRMRESRNPIARLWRKIFTYWLRWD